LVDDGKDATIGMPYIKGATVKGTFEGVKKGKKITIVRYKAKSNRDRKIGHRQKHAAVRIEAI
ncbi:MAG TPA: 50S ribosomal protein L21, partial [Candidatus Paceibacterota bacterium]|nr:50S ribosomal protein L21 [Candidatus Paceibacterota bacterium]